MHKSILAGILAAIALLVVYGANASSRLTAWLDQDQSPEAQANVGQGGRPSQELVALNGDDFIEPMVDVSGMTPLEKAGTLPKRQTIGATSNFGGTPPAVGTTDDTDGVIVEADPPAVADPDPATAPPTPAPAPSNAPTSDQPPIRALW